MGAIVAWFLNSKIGRVVAQAAAVIIAVVLVLCRVFAAGKASEKAAAEKASLENLRKRSESDETIANLPAGSRREHLSEWVRD